MLDFDLFLARVKPVFARDGFQQERHIGGRSGDWPGMVEREFDGEDARVGNEAVGGFEAIGAAPGTGNANGAALVAANRHITLARHYQSRAATGRAASRAGGIVRVMHRPGV